MLKKLPLPAILALLAYAFWASPDVGEVAAGVAIFLFGMLALEEGFRAFTGGLLERVLKRSTNKFYKALGFGVVTTTLMQSSSLVSVITISFLSAGMIGMHAGLGIIFGANLGTTTGAWLVAGFGLKVKISAYALPMLVFGIILIFQKSKVLKGIGYILAGLGFLFLGIHYMKEGFEAFKASFDLAAYAVPGYPGLFLFLALGVLATVVMQSSHATLVLIITALASNQITYENALALAIGANIGTTITAILGAMGANIQGKRLAGGHLIFNVATGLIAIVFIHPFVAVVDYVSDGIGIGADDHSLRLAVFHTLFNLVGVIVMSPLLNLMVRVLERALPAKEKEQTRPMYLSESAGEFSDTAIEAVRMETDHLYENAFLILAHGIDLHRSEVLSDQDLNEVVAKRTTRIEIDIDENYEKTVKVLYGAIVEFTSKARCQLTPEQGERLHDFRLASRHIVEAVKSVKHLRKNLAVYIASDNPHIRQAYNDIRVRLGNVLRELAAFRDEAQAGDEIEISELDSLRLAVKEADVLASGTLDDLIRDDLISAKMASSLMNDSSYTFYTVNHLVEMAESLYGAGDPGEREAERAVTLSADEFDDIVDEEKPTIVATRPKFIEDAALESPNAALAATRLETENLYDKAFAILSHGIDLHRREILSTQDLTDVTASRTEAIEINFDEDYEQTVKVLYGAITRFVSRARTQVPHDRAERLLCLRSAAGDVVEAVKCVKHVRKNLSHFVKSDNADMKRAYNDIRILLGKVMRVLADVKRAAEAGEDDAVGPLVELDKTVKQADILANGSLDMLVRDDRITPGMATSLMNDNAYAQHAATHLINMADCVFSAKDVQEPRGTTP